MRIKHNKKRNTAFVYEALIKEATVAILKKENLKRDKAIELIKIHFKPGSNLRKDLDCYRSLWETTNLDRLTSEKILKESKLQRRLLDPTGLFKAQSALIKDVNKELSPQVFNNFVPNYKSLATIAQIFSDKISPKDRVILENEIIIKMAQTDVARAHEPVDNIIYRTFAQKFNNKYESELLEEQKQLLNYYVSSFADNSLELKLFLNEEIKRLITTLEEAYHAEEIKNDKDMVEKTEKIVEKLKSYSDSTVTDDVLLTVMRTQQLVKEIYNDGNHS
tara:strand:- start:1252 stop:2082 length:831 start_codon:yes stop_codon:yes gene_type:complete